MTHKHRQRKKERDRLIGPSNGDLFSYIGPHKQRNFLLVLFSLCVPRVSCFLPSTDLTNVVLVFVSIRHLTLTTQLEGKRRKGTRDIERRDEEKKREIEREREREIECRYARRWEDESPHGGVNRIRDR